MNKPEQLFAKHRQLVRYQKSLRRTHRRLENAVSKSPCAYLRAVRIGLRLIFRSRRNLAAATQLYQEYMAAVKQERENLQQ